MTKLTPGLIAGAVAAVPMSLVLLAARWLGLFWTAPPAQIAKNAADEAGLGAVAAKPAFGPVWLGLHVIFGAVCGLGYDMLKPKLPKPPLAGGIVYGLFVWAVNYFGVMPALGLFPPPRLAGSRRTGVMIVAHVVYGAALALLDSARRRRS